MNKLPSPPADTTTCMTSGFCDTCDIYICNNDDCENWSHQYSTLEDHNHGPSPTTEWWCPICEDTFTTSEGAQNCCQAWTCPECHDITDDYEDALLCCTIRCCEGSSYIECRDCRDQHRRLGLDTYQLGMQLLRHYASERTDITRVRGNEDAILELNERFGIPEEVTGPPRSAIIPNLSLESSDDIDMLLIEVNSR